uniref:ANT-34 n=1 Tax=Toxocara canis TaxID=6265 RepID=B5A260_TOXCA|nr:ANT-34 [Toxocara canis]
MLIRLWTWVTWGGPPQIRNPIDGERLIVVYLPKLNEACVIASSYQEVCTGKGFFKGPATIPGLSGGAVFGVSRIPGDGEVFSDEVELIGLAGTNISSRGLSTFYGDEDVTWQVEYMQHRTETTIDLGDEPGYIKMAQIMQSPGTGKTRQHVPRMAFQALQAGIQVVVSPPTRVICGEVATLLDEIPGARVTRNWRGGLRRRDWNIMVTPHAVLFRLLYLRSGMLKKQTVFFIDEAHFSDTKTIALCKFLRHRVEETLDTAIFLTATGKDWKTGQDRICDISNYPIADHDIPSHNVVQFVEDHLRSWMGKKVIVFCNSVGGEGLSIRTFWRKLRNNPAADVIAFSRNTFERNYPLVKKDPEMDKAMIVLTTNMSECGININADIVVDTGQQVAFKVKNGCVVRSMERTTMAQQVQRRGRVGRRKPGDYYKVVSHEPQYTISRPMEIEEIEALVLCDKAGIPLTHLEKCKVDALGLVVTDSQIVRWLDGETQSLIGATVVYDTEGNIRTASGRAALINSWKDRGEIVNFGSRKVRLRYYDARDRELFVKALKLGGIKDEEHEEEHQDKCEACGTLWYHHFDGRSCRSKCPTCVCEEVEAAELAKIADDVE